MRKWILYLSVFIFSFTASIAAEETDPYVAKTIKVSGIVMFRSKDSFFWEEVKTDTRFYNFDEIKTTSESDCEIMFREGHILKMDANSSLTLIATNIGKRNLWQNLSVSVGKIWVKIVRGTDETEQLLIETPYARIPKNEALFSVSAPYGNISTFEGSIEVIHKVSKDKKMVIKEGHEAVVDSAGRIQESKPLSTETLNEFKEFAKSSSLSEKELMRQYYKLEKETYDSRQAEEKQQRTDYTPLEKATKKKSVFSRIFSVFNRD